jgi:hypothetical protein
MVKPPFCEPPLEADARPRGVNGAASREGGTPGWVGNGPEKASHAKPGVPAPDGPVAQLVIALP